MKKGVLSAGDFFPKNLRLITYPPGTVPRVHKKTFKTLKMIASRIENRNHRIEISA